MKSPTNIIDQIIDDGGDERSLLDAGTLDRRDKGLGDKGLDGLSAGTLDGWVSGDGGLSGGKDSGGLSGGEDSGGLSEGSGSGGER